MIKPGRGHEAIGLADAGRVSVCIMLVFAVAGIVLRKFDYPLIAVILVLGLVPLVLRLLRQRAKDREAART